MTMQFFYDLGGLNQQVFCVINNITNISFIPHAMQVISWFCSAGAVILMYTASAIYFLGKSYLQKDKLKIQKICDVYWRFGLLLSSFGASYGAIKYLMNLPRPFCSLPDSLFKTIVNYDNVRCLSSFPSAHVGIGFLILLFFWRYFSKTQKMLGVLVLMLVAISRITLAMHYPSDIIYSLPIAYAVYKFNKHFISPIFPRCPFFG